jgi:predicted permease
MAAKTPMWRRYLRLWGPNPRADLESEISYHLDELVAHLIARGMTPEQAHADALRRFGSVSRVRDECHHVDQRVIRERRRRDMRDALWNDIVDAGRGLTRSPGFTIGATLILALGIGLNTAVYSFNKALLFPSVPIGDPSRVVRVWSHSDAHGVFVNPLSEGDVADVMDATRSFEAFAAFALGLVTVTGGREAEQVPAIRATVNLFPLLQVSPSLGRPFTEQDATRDDPVVILSDRTWRNRFGGDPAIVGRTISIDGRAHTIVGVMPEPFWFELRETAMYLPMPLPRTDGSRAPRRLMAIARLKNGTSQEAAQQDVQIVAKRSAQEHPQSNSGWDVLVTGLLPFGPGEKVFFALVTTLSALLLAAACAHIANLLLARGIERRAEIAVRGALGASRGRIVRQLFAESLALATVGGALSLLVAYPMVQAIRVILGPSTPFLSELSLDASALAATFGFIVLACLLFGIAPALRLSTITASDGLNPSAGARIVGQRRPLAGLLIGFEVAVATLALVVTFLFITTVNNVFRAPLGFTADGVVTFRIDVPQFKYPERDDAARLLSAIRDRLERMPSASAAGAGSRIPMNAGVGLPTEPIAIEDLQNPAPEKAPWAVTSIVTPGYFDALGIPIVDGRSFEPRDGEAGTPVAVVSRSLASAYWPNQRAVGRRLRRGDASQPWVTVIGVVGDVRPVDPTSPQVRQLYVPFAQAPLRSLVYFARTKDDPAAHLQTVRALVGAIDADVPVADLRTLQAAMDDTLKGQRFGQNTLRVNAALSLLLALTGVYSVMAIASARRRREIAIRVALGGRRDAIVAMLLRQALRPAFVGVAVGLALAALVSRAIEVMLFGVNPLDPLTYTLSAAVMCTAVAAASCLPAIRATRVDPAAALRAE